MLIEHCIFLSWFSAEPESHEQDGERLRVAASGKRTVSGDPAMAFRACLGARGDSFSALACLRRRRRSKRTTASLRLVHETRGARNAPHAEL